MTDSPPRQFSTGMRERLLHERIVVLDGALDDDNGTLLASQLLTLAAEDPRADIALWIHSPGGSVPAMLALGLACSAGQFLLSAGARGKRVALPHARILMHQGSAGIGGSAVEIELQADDLRHTRDTVLALIAHDTGQSVERIFEDSLHDRWYTAEEARAYGFVDAIVTSFAQVLPRPERAVGIRAAVGGAR
jgi:ATP-dependent Clp protease protease subunit